VTALELARGALAALERSRRRIDDLNVYPVPDGDTGTNLTLTGRAIVEALEQSTTTERAAIAKELTRAALMGARGNSGVILSQIVRGFVEVAGDRPELDVATVADAFRSASEAAYRGVRKPVEGTMLTVIRELAEAAEGSSARDVEALLVELVRAGEESVRGTTEKLDVLRHAGVVDAGGAGLVEILRGIASVVTGEPLPEAPPELEEVGVDAIHQELSDYRYCTTFVIEGENLARDELESELEPLGDSLLVVGDADAMKVHVHTDEPGTALSVGTKRGTIAGVEIANMHVQTMQREERLLESVPGAIEVVAVVAGKGNRRLFESLGATRIVEGGQTMNPSTAELVAAVEATGADAVILLPNNSNVIMSAEQAAELITSKDVHVIPSDSIPSGLAALVRFDGSRSAGENVAEMRAALEEVTTGEVTIASRDAQLNGLAVPKGAYLGLADGEAVAVGESFEQVVADVVERLLERPRDVLTLLTGEGAPTLDGVVAAIGERHPDVEVDVQEGGQPHYPLLLSAE
jgi:uncharacterized protein